MTFQICSKKLFLTYPECPEPKEEVYEFLNTKFCPLKIIVAEEKHKNGNNHLHAYLELEKAFRSRDPKFADYKSYHGNYQGCRSTKNVAKYVTKEDNFISNCDVAELLGTGKGEKEILGKRIIDGESLYEIVKECPKYLFGFKKLKEDIDAFRLEEKLKNDSREIPAEVPNPWGIRCPVDTDNKKCHYWFYSSQPNKGKTTGVIIPLVREHHAVLLGEKTLYHQVDEGTKIICLDELRKGSISYSALNSICDGTFQFRVFMRGNVTLKEKPLVIVCSNFSIEEVFPYMKELVYARFYEHNVS